MQESPTTNPEEQPNGAPQGSTDAQVDGRTDAPAPAPPDAPLAEAPAPTNVVSADEESIARAAQLLRDGGRRVSDRDGIRTRRGRHERGGGRAGVQDQGPAARSPRDRAHRPAAALADWARDIPESAHALAEAFWPGPLTLILKRAPHVPDAVTGGQDTVGLRVPEHPVAQALLDAFGREDGEQPPRGLAAPSANKFGHVSPTTAMHVRADLGDEVDLVLDGGAAEFGIESTVLDLSGEQPAILRPGAVSAEEIERVLGAPLQVPDAQAPRTPGARPVHYAPRAKVRLVRRVEMLEALASRKGQRFGVLALEVTVPRLAAGLQRVCPAIASRYAHELYANLRALDAQNVSQILVEAPPRSSAWNAINDRLARAARGGEQGLEDAA